MDSYAILTDDFRIDSEVLGEDYLSILACRIASWVRPQKHRGARSPHQQFPFSIVTITDEQQERPFVLQSRRRARITTWQSSGVCFFSRLTRSDYYTLCCLLSLTQLKALTMNTLLDPDDLVCESESCSFARRESLQEYALLFEGRSVCAGCLDFYHCLGADIEVLGAQGMLATH